MRRPKGDNPRSYDFDGKDANEAEMFALLSGCRELSRLDGYKAIIEGDSFSVIQWGLGNLLILGGLQIE